RRLCALISAHAKFSIRPFDLGLHGTPDIAKWYVGQGSGCDDSRMIATRANGCAALPQYKRADSAHPVREPWAVQVVETRDGKIPGIHHWIPPFAAPLFEAF